MSKRTIGFRRAQWGFVFVGLLKLCNQLSRMLLLLVVRMFDQTSDVWGACAGLIGVDVLERWSIDASAETLAFESRLAAFCWLEAPMGYPKAVPAGRASLVKIAEVAGRVQPSCRRRAHARLDTLAFFSKSVCRRNSFLRSPSPGVTPNPCYRWNSSLTGMIVA